MCCLLPVTAKTKQIMIFQNRLFLIFFILLIINDIWCDSSKQYVSDVKYSGLNYVGEKFPTKYLVTDGIAPSREDLRHYITNLSNTVEYFVSSPNETDCNVGLGFFFLKSLLKRALLDDGDKLEDHDRKAITNIIKSVDYYISHYVYINKPYGSDDYEYRISTLYVDDKPQVYSTRPFNRNRLKRWILSNKKINEFAEDMDELSMPKEKYVNLVESMSDYYVSIEESDKCLSRISYNPVPIDMTQLQPCRRDNYCLSRLHSSPSVAYALSHRYLNIMLPRTVRRCYMSSQEEDDRHMDVLCAYMYREAVYIARRGYFARDMFLEHIALCSILGYEEFHRQRWFYKVTSWLDEQGCMREFPNYDINRTAVYLKRAKNKEDVKRIRRNHKNTMESECHHHPMALLTIVLGHAIRHAVHFMT